MVDPERFELSTSTLQGLHSPGLSYGPIINRVSLPIGLKRHVLLGWGI